MPWPLPLAGRGLGASCLASGFSLSLCGVGCLHAYPVCPDAQTGLGFAAPPVNRALTAEGRPGRPISHLPPCKAPPADPQCAEGHAVGGLSRRRSHGRNEIRVEVRSRQDGTEWGEKGANAGSHQTAEAHGVEPTRAASRPFSGTADGSSCPRCGLTWAGFALSPTRLLQSWGRSSSSQVLAPCGLAPGPWECPLASQWGSLAAEASPRGSCC